jgi:CheY-like chemotaxis protein
MESEIAMLDFHRHHELLNEASAEVRKILCIEDDREIAQLIAEELTDRGFDVIIAYDGREGLIAILKGLADLVLCDVGLPHLSGFEILNRLKELSPRLNHVPFVFITALSDPKIKLQAQRLGAGDCMTKPLDFETLETTVRDRLATVAANETWSKAAMLSDREAEALTWVARGKTSAQIAEMIGLGEQDVEFHLGRARVKIETATRPDVKIKPAKI